MFTWVDAIALGILALMFIRGWAAGFIIMAGNLVSLVLGVVVTAWIFSLLSGWHVLANWHIEHPVLAIVIFLIVLSIVVKLLRLVVALINSLYKIVSLLPFMGAINRLLGAAVGLAEGVVLLVVLVYLTNNILFNAGLLSYDMRMFIAESTSFARITDLMYRLPFLFPELGIWV